MAANKKKMECEWCGKMVDKYYRGFVCSEYCWNKNWFDNPRGTVPPGHESPDTRKDIGKGNAPHDNWF